ncbi:hypothetical protein NSB1T_06415 [Coprobacter fastidiosus NSB1 = JCM 33896]|nr:hypothetical protein NSB1T_06415 [Coprobacter fastidiosus NSB1 = JCM 33896]
MGKEMMSNIFFDSDSFILEQNEGAMCPLLLLPFALQIYKI